MSRRLLLSLTAIVVTTATSVAGAAGPGDIALYGAPARDGVTTAKSPYRFVSVYPRRGTILTKIRKAGGSVVQSIESERGYQVPAIADDGSASGLSADGRTLVLTLRRARFPERVSRFAVVDAVHLRFLRYLTLRGDFNLDAISPDGSTLYLIQYQSRTNPLRYAVRAYDVLTRRLYPKAVVDPREPDEAMRGYAVTRVMSPDGRWAYTLYQGGEHPFIHALDTESRTARCIDLPDALTKDSTQLGLRLGSDGRRLTVLDSGDPAFAVDAGFRVHRAPVISYRASRERSDGGGPSLAAMGGTGLGVLVLAATAALAVRRRRQLG